MVGRHHRLDGHEFEQTLGDSEGQGGLEYCSPCCSKELDMTGQLNNNKNEVGSQGPYQQNLNSNWAWYKKIPTLGDYDTDVKVWFC